MMGSLSFLLYNEFDNFKKKSGNNKLSAVSVLSVSMLYFQSFCLERFPLPLGAWDGLRYFIVALPEPSI